MFPYDPVLSAALGTPPDSIAGVVAIMHTIDATCDDADGLKWFNWLYLQVTEAVGARVAAGGFSDPAWLAELDVQFAPLYFDALGAWLAGELTPDCWRAVFERRDQTAIARIQFALAGINAHINHDLAIAIFAACAATGTVPQHGSERYNDFTALNTTLDSLIESAKSTLRVRLPGDALPPVAHLDDTIAAWSVSAAREAAWRNAELLWHLREFPMLTEDFMDTLDGLTKVANKALLVPVP